MPKDRFAEWRKLWEKLKTKYKQTDREWRLLRLVQEVGDAAKCVTYSEYYGIEGFREELKKALADAFAMLIMMALNEGIELEEMEKLGLDELEHAIKERLPK